MTAGKKPRRRRWRKFLNWMGFVGECVAALPKAFEAVGDSYERMVDQHDAWDKEYEAAVAAELGKDAAEEISAYGAEKAAERMEMSVDELVSAANGYFSTNGQQVVVNGSSNNAPPANGGGRTAI